MLNYTYFDLNQLLEQLSVDFYLQTAEKGICLTTDIDPVPFEMYADSEKIVRIFSNLISNALKYGKTATKINIIARKTEDEIHITVRNNGEPIPEKSVPKLFERSYRADPSRNQNIEGTGLGLAIVKNIVTAHHGTIAIESNAHWTSFIMTFPIEP